MPLVQITLMKRPIEQKREIAKVVTAEIARICNISESRVKMYFYEVESDSVVNGGKLKSDE